METQRATRSLTRSDALPWILTAAVVLIMGAAVALYPTESSASDSARAAPEHADTGAVVADDTEPSNHG